MEPLGIDEIRRRGFAAKLYSEIPFDSMYGRLWETVRALPNHCLIILFRSSVDFGHYVSLAAGPDGRLQYFDSTGHGPDGLAGDIGGAMRQKLGESGHRLRSLLEHEAHRGPVEYSLRRLQGPVSQACGLYAMLSGFLGGLGLSVDEFAKAVRGIAASANTSVDDLLEKTEAAAAL